jgi:hypothetical protein
MLRTHIDAASCKASHPRLAEGQKRETEKIKDKGKTVKWGTYNLAFYEQPNNKIAKNHNMDRIRYDLMPAMAVIFLVREKQR